jgi:integrase/recombinase XerD
VPIPPALLATLDMVHGIREQHARHGRGRHIRLWPWSRMTGWRPVHGVMQAAELERRAGHVQLSTTAVSANAVGAEEKDIERRMWG